MKLSKKKWPCYFLKRDSPTEKFKHQAVGEVPASFVVLVGCWSKHEFKNLSQDFTNLRKNIKWLKFLLCEPLMSECKKTLLFCDAAKKKTFSFYTEEEKNLTAFRYGGQIFNLSENIE